MRNLALALACVAAFTSAHAEDVVGRASVIDGNTLEIHGARIRLCETSARCWGTSTTLILRSR